MVRLIVVSREKPDADHRPGKTSKYRRSNFARHTDSWQRISRSHCARFKGRTGEGAILKGTAGQTHGLWNERRNLAVKAARRSHLSSDFIGKLIRKLRAYRFPGALRSNERVASGLPVSRSNSSGVWVSGRRSSVARCHSASVLRSLLRAAAWRGSPARLCNSCGSASVS